MLKDNFGLMRTNLFNKNRAWGTSLYVLTPVLLFVSVICLSVILLVGPFSNILKYANFIFSSVMPTDNGVVFSGEIDESRLSHSFDEIPDDAVIKYPYVGDAYATLHSPEVDIDCHVYWGDTKEILRKGAGNYCGSAPVGVSGNTVICAHVSMYFKNLSKLKSGDTVILTTEYGRFTYVVRESFIFNENDLSYILPTEEDILTLYTCHNYIAGPTPERYGVICDITQAVYYGEEG